MALFFCTAQHTQQATTQLSDARALLTDTHGALFGFINLGAALILLAASSHLHWDPWLMALCCAGVHAVYNTITMMLMRQHGLSMHDMPSGVAMGVGLVCVSGPAAEPEPL